ncbi:Juvenile hormone epoxide hydrolase [Eumeta japonica]|uniref:Juvenile hormone epoxide hydrolase n=1 Tax=Eumeta variegata TaxID=151549 RepID=A0A4C1VSN7_EUMVA|nr:Juvenile hormone epoxide hydrolase [Eumeta japonica]
MLHGWPGSIREFYEIIPKLTKVRHGHKFVFEIIAPSIPGFGFSQATSKPGLGSLEIAVIMKNLMERIGIEKYYIQGGDAGHVIGSIMATLFPEKVMGFHTNFVNTLAPSTWILTFLGSFWPSLVVEKELEGRMYPLSEHFSFLLEESGYSHIQASKPDTIGIALTDSPAGLAAYILEKFSTWTNPTFKRASDGELLKKYELTNLLDNVMIYWSSKCITTSMRLYSETLNKRHMAYQLDAIPTLVPTWGIKFKYELSFTPDWILKMKYKNYLQSTNVEDGGHFAAFENPEIMAKDIFDAVETFEEFHGGDWNKSNGCLFEGSAILSEAIFDLGPVWKGFTFNPPRSKIETFWKSTVQRERNSAVVKLFTKMSQWRKIRTRGRTESSNLSNIEHRAVIKYFVKKGKTPKEILKTWYQFFRNLRLRIRWSKMGSLISTRTRAVKMILAQGVL